MNSDLTLVPLEKDRFLMGFITPARHSFLWPKVARPTVNQALDKLLCLKKI